MPPTTRFKRLAGSRHALDSPAERRVDLTLLARDIKQRRGAGSLSSSDFFRSAVKALSEFKGTANAELRLNCLFDCGMYFFNGGQIGCAEEVVQLVMELAGQTRNKSWQRKAFNFCGMVNADAGNLGQAFISYQKALEIARDIGDHDAETAVLVNVGVALMYAGLDSEAISCFQHVVHIAGHSPFTKSLISSTLSNLAQCHLHLEQYEEGLAVITKCIGQTLEATDSDSALHRTIREFTYVQIALGLGDIELAKERRDFCIRNGKWGLNERGKSLTNISVALCEIYGGDVERGLRILEDTLSAQQSVASKIDTLKALVKAYDKADRPQQALEHLGALVRVINESRRDSIAALTALSKSAKGSFSDSSKPSSPLTVTELKLRARAAEQEVINSRIEMLERLAITADLKEEASGEHGYRVGRLSALVAEDLGWSKEACHALDLAARLHDIGKIGVPDRILLTSAELKEAERHFMATHTLIGAELLAKSRIPHLQMAEEIARFHHEWWDGRGYPAKRKGKRIPVHARIVALADVFDALTHGRPFSQPWPIDRAVREIESRVGTQFDPEIAGVFLARLARLRREQPDLDAYLGKAGKQSPFLQARERIRMMLAEERTHERLASARVPDTIH